MKKLDLQMFANPDSGRKIVYLFRVLDSATTDDAVAMAFTTENSNTISKDADSTVTKDGTIRTPGGAELEITATALLAQGDKLYDKLKALGFEVERPGGTFYIFPKALEEDANAFCLRARDYDLLLVPSDSFGVKGYVRLAYCIDTEKVERSLPALEKLAASYRK